MEAIMEVLQQQLEVEHQLTTIHGAMDRQVPMLQA